MERPKDFDVVERPKHYNSHASGLEAIDLCEHLSFNMGNATKYTWRAGMKNDEVEDLKKALWYVRRERERLALYAQEPPIHVLVSHDGSSEESTRLTVRVLIRKIVAAEPNGVLGKVLGTSRLPDWEHIIEQEIAARQSA